MKKFIALSVVFLMATMVMFTSCKTTVKDTGPGPIEYSLSVAGATEGAVDLAYQHAILSLDGQATLDFSLKSDTIYNIGNYIVQANQGQETGLYNLDQVLTDKTIVCSAETIEAAKRLSTTTIFDVATATGTYDLTVKGFIREPVTGITLYVDRHLTNKSETPSNA